ncbi:MAG: Gfo/Idh/MocA family protein [Bacillota bacterium]
MFKKKLAVIGFGYWGKNIVRILLSLPLTEVAICDPALANPPFPGDSRVYLYSFAEILQDRQIEMMFIATPASTHYVLVKEALLAGKHVFVEKPFTLSFSEAEELKTIARNTLLILMVGHILQYHPAVLYLKEFIDSGGLGKILYFRSSRTSLGTVRPDTGVLWDMAVHDIDLACFLTGRLPLSVNAWNKAFLENSLGDMVTVQMTFPSGVIANLFASWLDPLKKRELVVVGDKKMAVFDDTSPSQKLAVIDRGVDYIKPYEYKDFGEYQLCYRYGDILYPFIDMQEPLRNEVIHFIDCVKNLSQPRTGDEKAVEAIKIMEAADLSARNGGETIFLDWNAQEGRQ